MVSKRSEDAASLALQIIIVETSCLNPQRCHHFPQPNTGQGEYWVFSLFSIFAANLKNFLDQSVYKRRFTWNN